MIMIRMIVMLMQKTMTMVIIANMVDTMDGMIIQWMG